MAPRHPASARRARRGGGSSRTRVSRVTETSTCFELWDSEGAKPTELARKNLVLQLFICLCADVFNDLTMCDLQRGGVVRKEAHKDSEPGRKEASGCAA